MRDPPFYKYVLVRIFNMNANLHVEHIIVHNFGAINFFPFRLSYSFDQFCDVVFYARIVILELAADEPLFPV
jgi:hypothetical protein